MRVLVMEHKTSSEEIGEGSMYWRRLILDGQVSDYLVGARALGYEPEGVYYDVLRKPDLRPLKATPVESRKYTKPTKTEPSRLYAGQRDRDETPQEYHDRVLDAIGEDPDKYFQRGIVLRLPDEELEAAWDAWDTAEMIAEAEKRRRFPRYVRSCVQYGSPCAYWPVCSGETGIDDNLRYEDADKEHDELDGKTHLPLVTHSSKSAFQACPRKYYYSYVMRRRPVEKSDNLWFGSLIHLGLETYLMNQADKTDALPRALSVMAKKAADEFELAKATAMLEAYHLRWEDDPIEVLAVEQEFQAPLLNPETGKASKKFLRGGKIDAIVAVKE